MSLSEEKGVQPQECRPWGQIKSPGTGYALERGQHGPRRTAPPPHPSLPWTECRRQGWSPRAPSPAKMQRWDMGDEGDMLSATSLGGATVALDVHGAHQAAEPSPRSPGRSWWGGQGLPLPCLRSWHLGTVGSPVGRRDAGARNGNGARTEPAVQASWFAAPPSLPRRPGSVPSPLSPGCQLSQRCPAAPHNSDASEE